MRVADYYRYISDEEYNVSTEKSCLENYLFAKGQRDYQFIADICQKLGLKGIIDIGCSYGYQSEIFTERRLKYHGIDSNVSRFWNGGETDVTFQNSEYPCFLNVETKNMLAVSRLCIGYTVHDYERIAKDFKYLLVDKNREAFGGLSRSFVHVSDLSTEGEGSTTYSLFARTEAEKEQLKHNLKTAEGQPKLHVCGLQFPGEDGITADRVIDLFEMTEGYYYDLIFIEGQTSAAYFVMDSHIYLEWTSNGIYPQFVRFIEEILDDTEKESPNGLYDFGGYKVYLGYM